MAKVGSWNPLERLFARSAERFYGSLDSSDVRRLAFARSIFLANSALSLVLYYGGASPDGRQAKFPATISWTVRRGLPKWANLAIWSAGWWQVARVFARRGDALARGFAAQMYLLGLTTVGICPVGQGAVTDAVHGACAGCYFVCHCVLHWYVRTAGAFRAGFFGSFAAFLLALGRVRGMEKKFGFLAESDSRAGKPGDGGDGATGRQLLQPEPRRLLFRYELAQMLCENGMFVSFLLGMTSGLPHKPQRAPG
jgi:hypothetical protein